jgi:hypothetical protein
MKFKIITIFLFLQSVAFAQKPCEYSVNVVDSLGTLKETKSCMVYEKVFGNSSQFIFLTLISDNKTPSLNVQIIQKSPDFIIPKCFDKDSRVYFELSNGKIYTLINSDEDRCGTLINDSKENLYNRILSSNFLFKKDDFEDIKKFPIVFMRIKYGTETIDYVLPKQLLSEKVNQNFEPEKFFIDYFSCIWEL